MRGWTVNEYCTSKFCNCCHNELDKFLIRKSNKPTDIMKNKNILVNGLVRHEVVNPDREEHLQICIAKCAIYHNRDKNAVQNIVQIVEELERQEKLLRFTRNESLGSVEFYSTKDIVFTRTESLGSVEFYSTKDSVFTRTESLGSV